MNPSPNTALLIALSDILAVVFDVAVNGHLMGEPRHLSPEDAQHIYEIARNAIMKAEAEGGAVVEPGARHRAAVAQ